MKIQIKVTVEVDPADWSEEYGCELGEVRDDVRTYFINQIQSSPAFEDCGLRVGVA